MKRFVLVGFLAACAWLGARTSDAHAQFGAAVGTPFGSYGYGGYGNGGGFGYGGGYGYGGFGIGIGTGMGVGVAPRYYSSGYYYAPGVATYNSGYAGYTGFATPYVAPYTYAYTYPSYYPTYYSYPSYNYGFGYGRRWYGGVYRTPFLRVW